MSKIKVSELFYSIQGEGKFSGVSSVFLRTFGCNFTCGGFGMPKGEISNERDVIADNVKQYSEYSLLPLVSTGCDSYASWDVRFKHLSPVLTSKEIAQSIYSLLPYKQWRDEHLVITGGEPLLGWQRSYPDLLEEDGMIFLKELTFETNGTQMLSSNLFNYLQSWTTSRRGKDKLTFSVSPKLSISGEKWDEAIQPDVINNYQEVGFVYLKFVIASDDDCKEALEATEQYRSKGFKGPVYLMSVGGVEDVFYKTNKQVAELAMKHGLRYSDRLQVGLFRNQWGT